MAQIFGESAAFADLLQTLFRIDSRIQPSDPSDLARCLDARRAELERSRRTLPAEILEEVAYRLADLDEQAREFAQRMQRANKAAAQRAASEMVRMQALREREGFILVRWLWQLRARWIGRRVERLREHAARESELAQLELRQARERLLRMQADPDGEARHRLAREHAVLAALESVARSPLAQRANREWEILTELQALPAGYVILRGLYLEPGSFVQAAPRPLQAALVDLLVVGPAGVFVVDVDDPSVGDCGAVLAGDQVGTGVAGAAILCSLLLQAARLPGAAVVVPGWRCAADLEVSESHLARVAEPVSWEARLAALAKSPRLSSREVDAIADFLSRFRRRPASPLVGSQARSVDSRWRARDCGGADALRV
jgi:hypothetical protein